MSGSPRPTSPQPPLAPLLADARTTATTPPLPWAAPGQEAPGGWPAFLAVLRGRSLAVAIFLAGTAAALLNPIFAPSFGVVLGRTLFLAAVLLVAYAASRAWPPRWLPRWLAPALAVALAAPLGTFVVYLWSTGGDLAAIFAPNRAWGFFWITASGWLLGLVLALGAAAREREAQAHAQALAFALERSRLEQQALDARLSLLQAQIEPHFLFNTLANVQALVESQSPRAPAVLKSLIDYLRAAMPRLQTGAPSLANEVALVKAYLALMQLRMPDRLRTTLAVPAELQGLPCPPLALMTLVENAVRHAIDPSEEGGHIEVGAERVGNSLHLWVQDDGPGLAETAQPGTGLSNLRSRLQATHGPAAQLLLTEVQPHGLRAEIVVPADTALPPHTTA